MYSENSNEFLTHFHDQITNKKLSFLVIINQFLTNPDSKINKIFFCLFTDYELPDLWLS